jgi:hypothetical protein
MEILNKIKKNKKEKIKNNKIKIKNNYKFSFENKYLMIKDENEKKIYKIEYIFFGIYNPTKNLWVWSSSIPGVNKNQINFIHELRKRSCIFEKSNNDDILFYYQLMTNDVLEINDKLLEKIEDLLLFLTDSKIIVKPLNSLGNIQFIGLTNIREKYI